MSVFKILCKGEEGLEYLWSRAALLSGFFLCCSDHPNWWARSGRLSRAGDLGQQVVSGLCMNQNLKERFRVVIYAFFKMLHPSSTPVFFTPQYSQAQYAWGVFGGSSSTDPSRPGQWCFDCVWGTAQPHFTITSQDAMAVWGCQEKNRNHSVITLPTLGLCRLPTSGPCLGESGVSQGSN